MGNCSVPTCSDSPLIRTTFGTDSLEEAKKVLERKKRALKSTQPALAAIYACALGQADEALANPTMLAHTPTSDFKPLFRPGNDVFANDLLSCIAWTSGKYNVAHDYYDKTGNRPAALVTALWMTPQGGRRRYTEWLDSLNTRYSDLEESLLVTALKAADCPDSTAIILVDSAMAKWPGSRYCNALRNIKAKAGRSKASITLKQKQVHSKSPTWLYLETKNLKSIDLAVYRKEGTKLATRPIWKLTKHLHRKASLGDGQRQLATSLPTLWPLCGESTKQGVHNEAHEHRLHRERLERHAESEIGERAFGRA